jgi:hypothetical protein
MKTRFLLALVAVCAATGIARAQSVDEIIAKNLAARGGIEKMRAVRTMVVTAKLATPGGSGSVTVRLRRPDNIQEELTLSGERSIRTYNGKSGWLTQFVSGKEGVTPLSEGELENLRDEGENGIDGTLADHTAKGNQVRFDGAAVVEGKTCYKLKVTLRSGHVQYQYLDSQSFLEIREELVRTFDGKETLIEETVGDYRDVGGILFAHTFVSGMAGNALKSTLSIETIELNPPLDESLFRVQKLDRSGSKPGANGSAAVHPTFGPAALPGRKGCAASSA